MSRLRRPGLNLFMNKKLQILEEVSRLLVQVSCSEPCVLCNSMVLSMHLFTSLQTFLNQSENGLLAGFPGCEEILLSLPSGHCKILKITCSVFCLGSLIGSCKQEEELLPMPLVNTPIRHTQTGPGQPLQSKGASLIPLLHLLQDRCQVVDPLQCFRMLVAQLRPASEACPCRCAGHGYRAWYR